MSQKGNHIVHVLDDPYYGTRNYFAHILVGDYIAYQYNPGTSKYIVRQRDSIIDWYRIDAYEDIESIIRNF